MATAEHEAWNIYMKTEFGELELQGDFQNFTVDR
jgi:hypothetical protein